MTDPAPLTDEELAEIEARLGTVDDTWYLDLIGVDIPREGFRFAQHARYDIDRLIADLRASRAEVARVTRERDLLRSAILQEREEARAEVERLREALRCHHKWGGTCAVCEPAEWAAAVMDGLLSPPALD